jgi:ketosteroid isomerase-like protein
MRKTAFILVALAFLPVTWAQAAAKEEAVSSVRIFMDAYNRDDAKSLIAACAREASILYDVPPYHWSGRDTCTRWLKDVRNEEHQEDISNIVATLEKIRHVMVSGTHAYVTVDLRFSFRWRGKEGEEQDVATFTLNRDGDKWLISGMALAL